MHLFAHEPAWAFDRPLAARSGDTVHLFDGTWDSSIDSALASTDEGTFGVKSGIAFAENVTLQAIHAAAVRIEAIR